MPAPPENFADRPASSADLLSELLRAVRLHGERLFAHGPLRTFAVGFTGVGALHIVDEGEVALRIDGVQHIERASPGDVILLPRGDRHHDCDAGGAQETRWLTGTFTIGDPRASHLLASLPPSITLRGAGGPALEGLEVARKMVFVEGGGAPPGWAGGVAGVLR